MVTKSDLQLDDKWPSWDVWRALIVGTVALLPLPVMPMYLARVVEDGVVTPQQVGMIIFAEVLSVAAGVVLAERFVTVRNSALAIFGALVVLSGLHIASAWADGLWLMTLRLMCGFMAGSLVLMAVNHLLHSANPVRFSAFFLVMQTSCQLLLSVIAAYLFAAGAAPSSIFYVVSGLCVMALSMAIGLRRQEQNTPVEGTPATPINGISASALLSIFLLMCVLGSTTAYGEFIIGSASGQSDIAALIVPCLLVGQVVGGLVASLIAQRMPTFPTVIVALFAVLGLLVITYTDVAGAFLLAAGSLIGFIWLFVAAVHVDWLLQIDPTRRVAGVLPTAQILGIALGPLICSAALSESGAPPFWLFALGLVISFAFALITRLRSPLRREM